MPPKAVIDAPGCSNETGAYGLVDRSRQVATELVDVFGENEPDAPRHAEESLQAVRIGLVMTLGLRRSPRRRKPGERAGPLSEIAIQIRRCIEPNSLPER